MFGSALIVYIYLRRQNPSLVFLFQLAVVLHPLELLRVYHRRPPCSFATDFCDLTILRKVIYRSIILVLSSIVIPYNLFLIKQILVASKLWVGVVANLFEVICFYLSNIPLFCYILVFLYLLLLFLFFYLVNVLSRFMLVF